MRYFLYDTETTGLTAKDEVIQLSGFLLNGFSKLEKIVNFYCETEHTISSGALAVHGLTRNILRQRSHGLTFEENFTTIQDIMNMPDITFVAYNAAFDNAKVEATLKNNGAKEFRFPLIDSFLSQKGRHSFCLMRGCAALLGKTYKNAQLAFSPKVMTELYNFLKTQDIDVSNVNPEVPKLMEPLVQNLYQVICSKVDSNASVHNALYDVFLSWLIFQTYGPYFIK